MSFTFQCELEGIICGSPEEESDIASISKKIAFGM
jgi:hypothetical protein